MSLLHTVVFFIVALGTLIVIHELGHYWVARWCGVKVLRFSVGFGKPLRTWVRGADRTEWVLAAFPLGGYVKMLDEREGPVTPQERARAFNRQGVWARIAIVSAGPVANFLLAILVYWVLFVYGVPGLRPMVDLPPPGSTAAAAGFEQGEIITRIEGEEVKTFNDLRWHLLDHAVARGKVELETHNDRNEINFRRLDLSGLTSDDLDGDFLDKIGLDPYVPSLPVIERVVADMPAARAGLQGGDRITAIDGRPMRTGGDVAAVVSRAGGHSLRLRIERDGRPLEVDVIPDKVSENGREFGRVGIAFGADPGARERLAVTVRYGAGEAVGQALARTWDTTAVTFKMLGKMIVGEVSVKNLSGPITIASYAGESARMGVIPFLTFIALISISLGVLNLLPVPMLDGGHLLYYFIEVIKRSPVSDRVMEMGQRAGLFVLLLLMVVALYNDLHRLLGAS